MKVRLLLSLFWKKDLKGVPKLIFESENFKDKGQKIFEMLPEKYQKLSIF